MKPWQESLELTKTQKEIFQNSPRLKGAREQNIGAKEFMKCSKNY